MFAPTAEQRLSSAATAPMSASTEWNRPTPACASGPPGGAPDKEVEMRRADRKTTEMLRAGGVGGLGGWGVGGVGGWGESQSLSGIWQHSACFMVCEVRSLVMGCANDEGVLDISYEGDNVIYQLRDMRHSMLSIGY